MNDEIQKTISELSCCLNVSLELYFGKPCDLTTKFAILYFLQGFPAFRAQYPITFMPDLEQTLQKHLESIKFKGYAGLPRLGTAIYAEYTLSVKESISTHDLCLFAMTVGMAFGAAQEKLTMKEAKSKGGRARANKIEQIEEIIKSKVIKIEGWEKMSASKLASYLIGMQSIPFEQRKISDVISKFKKAL